MQSITVGKSQRRNLRKQVIALTVRKHRVTMTNMLSLSSLSPLTPCRTRQGMVPPIVDGSSKEGSQDNPHRHPQRHGARVTLESVDNRHYPSH